MTKLCQCCSKRYFCKEVDTKENAIILRVGFKQRTMER